MHSTIKPQDLHRVKLSNEILDRFFNNIFQGSVSALSRDRGLPYQLIYNLVHGRIKSLSTEEYGRVFREDPPYQIPKRIDGSFFRRMVRLWLYLDEHATEAALYREFYPDKGYRRVDYRIFTGDIGTVTLELENKMIKKFSNQGLDRSEIEEWTEDFIFLEENERVPYKDLEPILDFIREKAGINPSLILNQWAARYKTGELSTVSAAIYRNTLALKEKIEEALNGKSRFELERIREDIYGRRKGMVLFAEIEDELAFIKLFGGMSQRKYLGRSVSHYKKGTLRRIASWRAERIKEACKILIQEKTDIPLRFVPGTYLIELGYDLLSLLKNYLKKRVIEDDSAPLEKLILAPSYENRGNDKENEHSITSMDDAPQTLGISPKAFDLLVAKNSKVFRSVGKYNKKWYLPNNYLSGLLERDRFELIKVKYEIMAKELETHHH